jgi:hypothetical protein
VDLAAKATQYSVNNSRTRVIVKRMRRLNGQTPLKDFFFYSV